jgi:hypothetical protein
MGSAGGAERDGLGVGDLVGAADVPDGHGLEEDALGAGVLAVLVAVFDGDGCEDPDALALAWDAVELQPGAKAGDVAQGDAAPVGLDGQGHLVSDAVSREAVAGSDVDPALPAVGGEQRAGGPFGAVAVGFAARVALVVGQGLAVEAAGHRGLPSVGARPAGGPIPRHPHARQGVPPSGGGSARRAGGAR